MSTPDFREFALAVYQEHGVSAAALELQGSTDVDVNVLLLAAYAGAIRGGALSEDHLAEIDRRVGAWQREVVVPLRTLRTLLKTGPHPAPGPVTDQLRDHVKALELDAELVELRELEALAESLDLPDGIGGAEQRATASMTDVIAGAAGRTVTDDEVRAVAVIAAAAARYGDRR